MKRFFSFTTLLCISVSVFSQVKLQALLTENLTNPIGIDIQQPRFSWQLVSAKRNVAQSAYEIKVVSGKSSVWNSGKVTSDQSVHIRYGGTALQSGKKYNWQVRVWDNGGKVSAWSPVAFFQTALFNLSDWKAKWIEPGFAEEATRPSPYFRKKFRADKKIAAATVYITAHGMYEAQINGKRVGDAYLTPGWTSYNKRLQYQVYNVTDLLQQGNNAVGVVLGSGWYRSHLAWNDNKDIYGKTLGLFFQLNITYSDGSMESIISDDTWKSSTGGIVFAEIYDGETIDAQKEKSGWSTASYDDNGWSGVKVVDYKNNNLLAEYNQPVRKHEMFKALRVLTTPKGEKVIDFGQNLVGWVVVKAKGNAGEKITIQHAEVLDKEGNFYTDNLRAAKATGTYILKGGSEETFEPHFTFYGFRYIKIEGYPGEIKPENFNAVALYSDMPLTGSFSCSNPLLNQLQHNIQWGQNGNFLDVPTDCPQRDERLGWTGDAQVFSRTATYNRNVNNFFVKWMKDVEADQQPNGSVPFVVPNVLGAGAGASTGWADVATIVPWNIYMAYADTQILINQYASMKAWVEYMQEHSKNDLWNTGFHFGDWLFYRPDDDNDGRAAVTDKYMIAQCFYANSVQLLIKTAKVLGKEEDVSTYSALLQKLKEAFVKEYMTSNGRLVSGTQTAYVLALNFDMLPESLRKQAAERLAVNIESYDNHLTTGFLGASYLPHVLTRFGYDSVAYKLLLQESYPSWLYPVKMGATTIWERWDGQKPDSSFQTPGMNSFNHYAYGAIGDWMYRTVAGLREGAPGYKEIIVQPHPGGNLTQAHADLKTYYGNASSHWKIENGKLQMDVEIPVNTKATVYIPAKSVDDILEGGKAISTS
ncbi:MAG: glycoside hydrolase family 78 protein, partial [Bacteroidetes bacterium]|nr:glycoside hydrolase family 78 protein [Bacteroidota bacterium]